MLRRVGVVLGAIILAVLVWAGVNYSRANMETKTMTDEVRKAAGGSYLRLPEGIVHYQLGGPDTGRIAVLVHGFSVPYYIWDSAYDALTAAGIRTVRLDLFGRGYSDRPDIEYSADLFDREIIGLLDSLKILEPVDIAGLSMGGEVAEYFANHHPNRTHSVILVDPGFNHGGGRQPWPMHVPLLRNYLMTVHAGPGMANGQMSDFAHPDRFPDWPARYKVQMQYPGFLNAIRSTRLADEGRDLSKEYAELGKKPIPVLLIWGREDQTVPFARSEELVKLIPQAEFHAIDDAGHVPFMEQPAVVNPILINFLRPVPPKSAKKR